MVSLKFLAPNFYTTFQRFPVSVLCSLALYALTFDIVKDEGMQATLIYWLGGGFFMFGIARLAREAYNLSSAVEASMGILGTAAVYLTTVIYGSVIAFVLQPVIFFLLILTIPFVFRSSDDVSFWSYKQAFATNTVLAMLGAVLLGAGLCIALVSIHFLFDVEIPNSLYFRIMGFAAIVYGPFIALSWMPQKFETQPAECHAPPGLPFLLNWILAPLAVLYFLILYGYSIKILLQWDVPRGHITYMVSGFGGLGILFYLSGWIMRDTGNALVRFLYRHFFKLLMLPVALLFVAIFMRIGQYGLTEQRYYVVLLALWFGGLAIYYTLRPAAPLKYILASLAALLILSSFGPWGAVSLSERAQIERLKDILTKNQMLENGVALPTKKDVTMKDQGDISSILEYFSRTKHLGRIGEIIPEIKRERRRIDVSSVMKNLNLTYVSKYQQQRGEKQDSVAYPDITYRAKRDFEDGYDIKGYDRYIAYLSAFDRGDVQDVSKKKQYRLILNDNNLTLDGGGHTIVLAGPEELLALAKAPSDRPPVAFEKYDGRWKAKFVVLTAGFKNFGEGKLEARHINGYLLIVE